MKSIRKVIRSMSVKGSFPPGHANVDVYEYYAPSSGNPTSGLVTDGESFKLNGKELQVIGGSMHYFRVHPKQWADRLNKMRACGLNTVTTYVPWNLHESSKGTYDYGTAGNDMSEFLNLTGFIEEVKKADLLLILRPGPYICSEWDFGGLPSWLLREDGVRVRTHYDDYITLATKYLSDLLLRIKDYQFTSGGPLIAVQIENEYGAFGYEDLPRDADYMENIKTTLESHLDKTFFFTSDSPLQHQDLGSLPGVLQTANFQVDPEKQLSELKRLQPNKPLMVTEFWTGWYDHWFSENHNVLPKEDFEEILETIFKQRASVNMYMFHGGTNFGFLSGANVDEEWPFYAPDITSYDYDAPLSEAGDYTEKYHSAKNIIAKYDRVGFKPHDMPEESKKTKYEDISVSEHIEWDLLLTQISEEEHETVKAMEDLDYNPSTGQSYGYVVYRKTMNLKGSGSNLTIKGHIRDMAQVLVDNKNVTCVPETIKDLDNFGFWATRNPSLTLPGSGGDHVVDIMVENLGRVNYGKPHNFLQKKGIWEGPVLLDEKEQTTWKIFPMDFNSRFVKSLSGWTEFSAGTPGPCVVKSTLTIDDDPTDTFLDMSNFVKGVAFVNGFNLGRYFVVGPQKTLYVPRDLLTKGDNEIVVFEQYRPGDIIQFSDKPILGEPKSVLSGNSGKSLLSNGMTMLAGMGALLTIQ